MIVAVQDNRAAVADIEVVWIVVAGATVVAVEDVTVDNSVGDIEVVWVVAADYTPVVVDTEVA